MCEYTYEYIDCTCSDMTHIVKFMCFKNHKTEKYDEFYIELFENQYKKRIFPSACDIIPYVPQGYKLNHYFIKEYFLNICENIKLFYETSLLNRIVTGIKYISLNKLSDEMFDCTLLSTAENKKLNTFLRKIVNTNIDKNEIDNKKYYKLFVKEQDISLHIYKESDLFSNKNDNKTYPKCIRFQLSLKKDSISKRIKNGLKYILGIPIEFVCSFEVDRDFLKDLFIISEDVKNHNERIFSDKL